MPSHIITTGSLRSSSEGAVSHQQVSRGGGKGDHHWIFIVIRDLEWIKKGWVIGNGEERYSWFVLQLQLGFWDEMNVSFGLRSEWIIDGLGPMGIYKSGDKGMTMGRIGIDMCKIMEIE